MTKEFPFTENGTVLTGTETIQVALAYVRHPARNKDEKVSKEDLSNVLLWAERLKTQMMIYQELLGDIIDGAFALDYRDGAVFLSNSSDTVELVEPHLARQLEKIVPGLVVDPAMIQPIAEGLD